MRPQLDSKNCSRDKTAYVVVCLDVCVFWHPAERLCPNQAMSRPMAEVLWFRFKGCICCRLPHHAVMAGSCGGSQAVMCRGIGGDVVGREALRGKLGPGRCWLHPTRVSCFEGCDIDG